MKILWLQWWGERRKVLKHFNYIWEAGENRSGWCLHASVRNVSEADRKGKLGRQKEIRGRENEEGKPCNLSI